MLPSKQALTAAATIVAATLFAIACNPDAATSPRSSATPLRAGPSLLAADEDEPAPPGGMLGPVPIPAPYMNYPGDGGVPFFGTAMTIPAHTSFVVKVSGNVSLASNPKVAECWPDHKPPYGAEGSYGPLGVASALGVRIGFTYKVNGATGWLDGGLRGDGGSAAASDTGFYARDLEVWASRGGYISAIGGGANCPPQGFYLMTSDQTISVVMLDGLALQLNPKIAVVRRGTKVKFVATADGAPIDGVNFTFTAPEGVTNTTSCTADGPGGCLLTVNNDGELKAFRELKGRQRSAKSSVRVYSSFTLEATESEINSGDAVIFTPIIDGAPGIAARWLWRDTKGGVTANPCERITDGRCLYSPVRSGTMWAYTAESAGGDSASASVTVKDDKPTKRVRISKAHRSMRFSTFISGERKCQAADLPETQSLTVSVVDAETGEVIPDQAVDLTLAAINTDPSQPDYGGHYVDKHSGVKEVGRLAATHVETGATGKATVVYTASVFAGQYEVLGTSQGAETGGDTLLVGMALQPYTQTAFDTLVGQKPAHPDNHYLTPRALAQVRVLTEWYQRTLNAQYKLNLNDMSLVHGGKFDVNADWKTPHCDHLDGRGIDLRTYSLPGKKDQEKIQKQWTSQIGRLLVTAKKLKDPFLPEGDPPHLHLKLWPDGARVTFPAASSPMLAGAAALPDVQTLRVSVQATALSARGDTLTFSYTARNDAASQDSVDFIVVDAPARPQSVIGDPSAEWWTGTSFAEQQVAAWGFIESHLPPGTTSPTLAFEAVGVPGIVKYWVIPVVPADSIMDVEDSGTVVGAAGAAADSGFTVGIIPVPSDDSPEANIARADALAGDACALGWIDNAGVCNSLRVKIREGSWNALMNELDGQRGKHVNDSAYFLLYATAQRMRQ